MLDDFREDNIVHTVGGRFKLSTLVQKRMVALNRGAQALVDLPTRDLMEIVIAEVKENKIYLDTTGRVQAVKDDSETVDALEVLLAEDDGGPGVDDLAD